MAVTIITAAVTGVAKMNMIITGTTAMIIIIMEIAGMVGEEMMAIHATIMKDLMIIIPTGTGAVSGGFLKDPITTGINY